MGKPVVMFDHDGVLVDSRVAFCRSFVASCREHGHREIATETQVVALFDGNVYESMLNLGLSCEEVMSIVDAASIALAAAPDVHLFPGIDRLLASLSARYDIVVVTSNHGDLVSRFLERAGQGRHIAAVIGREAGASKVDKISGVIAARPGQGVYRYVGDTRGDMIESRSAGAEPVGAAWGWHTAQALSDAGAVRVFREPRELLEYLLEQYVRA